MQLTKMSICNQILTLKGKENWKLFVLPPIWYRSMILSCLLSSTDYVPAANSESNCPEGRDQGRAAATPETEAASEDDRWGAEHLAAHAVQTAPQARAGLRLQEHHQWEDHGANKCNRSWVSAGRLWPQPHDGKTQAAGLYRGHEQGAVLHAENVQRRTARVTQGRFWLGWGLFWPNIRRLPEGSGSGIYCGDEESAVLPAENVQWRTRRKTQATFDPSITTERHRQLDHIMELNGLLFCMQKLPSGQQQIVLDIWWWICARCWTWMDTVNVNHKNGPVYASLGDRSMLLTEDKRADWSSFFPSIRRLLDMNGRNDTKLLSCLERCLCIWSKQPQAAIAWWGWASWQSGILLQHTYYWTGMVTVYVNHRDSKCFVNFTGERPLCC